MSNDRAEAHRLLDALGESQVKNVRRYLEQLQRLSSEGTESWPQLQELRRQLDSDELVVLEMDPDNPDGEPRRVAVHEEMGPEEFARFRAHLRLSLAELEAGLSVPAEEVLARLRSR